MKIQLKQLLIKALSQMEIVGVDPVVEFPTNPTHGDYTTNVALVVAKRLKRSPLEIAKEIKNQLSAISYQLTAKEHDNSTNKSGQKVSRLTKENSVLQDIEKIELVPPGFINFFLSASKLGTELAEVLTEKEGFGIVQPSAISHQPSDKSESRELKAESSRKIMVEFAHPNTHKAFHIGHLRNITTGEAIVRLLEAQGVEVIRANYQGDVGMHIAKALYGLLQSQKSRPKADQPLAENLKNKRIHEKVELLGKAYAEGSRAFEADEKAKEAIKDINYLIYASAQAFNKERGIEPSSTDYMKFVHGRGVEVDEIYILWKETRQWSLDYFEAIYKRVGSHYDRYYFESECLRGVDLAKEAVKKKVLEMSDGAIIFRGKPYGLDTRVFVNSLGLPTYEAKELALAEMETSEFGELEKIVHVVGPEQASFFQVTFKVEELLDTKRYKEKQFHLVYGWVKLKHGKMSSRSGNVVLGEWLIDEAKKEIYNILQKSTSKYTEVEREEIAEKAAIAAVKYSFLKVGTRQEIAFDIEKSVNFEGDSGPYLQYTYARCRSVLRKAGLKPSAVSHQLSDHKWNAEEKLVLRWLNRFPEVVADAAQNYAPNVLCEYLYDLASLYNTFYNKHSILGIAKQTSAISHQPSDKSETLPAGRQGGKLTAESSFRLAITAATAQVLKNGLYLLGIETLERM